MPPRKPKKGSRVKLVGQAQAEHGYPANHVFTVESNNPRLPYPYMLDDHDEGNPLLVGPFCAADLVIVDG